LCARTRPSRRIGDAVVAKNGNGEREAIERALREITKIQDGTITKVIKAVLERQTRFVSRLEELEERIAKLAREAGSR
jgi:hypothetical protein